MHMSSFPYTYTCKHTLLSNTETREGTAGGVTPTLSLSKGARTQKSHNESKYNCARQALQRANFCGSFHGVLQLVHKSQRGCNANSWEIKMKAKLYQREETHNPLRTRQCHERQSEQGHPRGIPLLGEIIRLLPISDYLLPSQAGEWDKRPLACTFPH